MNSATLKTRLEPPPRLKALQSGFGAAIRTPFSFATGKMVCQTHLYPPETVAAIQPRADEDPVKRLAVYNEQYGYRLLTLLQQDFPLLAADLGFWHFNQLASAYLQAYPSRSPYLETIPIHLPDFMRTHEAWAHKHLLQAAELDLACFTAFHAPERPVLNANALSANQAMALMNRPIAFQPWLTLLEEDWNGMERRQSLLQDEAKIARIEKKSYWAIFRERQRVAWLPLEEEAFDLLRAMQSGLSLSEACEKTAASLDEAGMQRLAGGIQGWFEQAMRLGWFTGY